jgi:hypothetical protein
MSWIVSCFGGGAKGSRLVLEQTPRIDLPGDEREVREIALVVTHDDGGERAAFKEVAQAIDHTPTERTVERGEGLVKEEQAGTGEQCAPESDALAFAAGEVSRLTLEEFVELEEVGDFGEGIRTRLRAAAEGEVLLHGEVRKEQRLLGSPADVSRISGNRSLAGRVEPGGTVDVNDAAGTRFHTGKGFQEGTLAAARGAREHPQNAGRFELCGQRRPAKWDLEFEAELHLTAPTCGVASD